MFTIKDTYGDAVEVEGNVSMELVYLIIFDSDMDSPNTVEAQAALTPKKARKLAKALRRAATIAEAGR